MSTTLSYGFVKPQNPDTGATFWTDLENDIQKVNDHTHNGVNSAPIVKSQSILSTNWGVAGSDGSYTQTITLTTGLTFDTIAIQFRTSTGAVIYPTVAKASSTTYTVTINDNSLALTAIYT